MSDNSLLEKLETFYIRFREIGQLITDPEVIQDMNRFVKLNKEYRDLEQIVEAGDELKRAVSSYDEAQEILNTETDKELKEMAEMEIEELDAKIPELESKVKMLLVPADPEDSKNVILEIRAGTGGDEASLFAGDLFRMYTKFCESKRWKIEITNYSEGTSGGYKEIVANITGDGVYGIMKYESGVHRVQRVPGNGDSRTGSYLRGHGGCTAGGRRSGCGVESGGYSERYLLFFRSRGTIREHDVFRYPFDAYSHGYRGDLSGREVAVEEFGKGNDRVALSYLRDRASEVFRRDSYKTENNGFHR